MRCAMKKRARHGHSNPREHGVPASVLLLWVVLALFVITNAPAQSMLQEQSRLPRTNLLVFHNRRGEVAPVRSVSDWEKRRAEILRGMEQVMGPLPAKEKSC